MTEKRGGMCDPSNALLWDEQALELMLLLRSGDGLLPRAMDCLAAKGMVLLSCEGAVAALDERAGLPLLLEQHLPV